MKKITLIFLVVLSPILHGQEEDQVKSKYQFGLDIGALYSSGSMDLNYLVGIHAENAHHKFGIGTMLGTTTSFYLDNFNEKRYALNAIQFSYECNPNPKGKRFDFFFFYTLNFHHNKGVYYTNTNTKNSIHALEFVNNFGSGFRLKFTDGFYLTHKMGLGAQVSRVFKKKGEAEKSTITDIDLGGYLQLSFGLNF